MREVTAIIDTAADHCCYVDSTGKTAPLGFVLYRGEWIDLRLTVKVGSNAAVLDPTRTWHLVAKAPFTGTFLATELLSAHTQLWVTATSYALYDVLWHGTSGYRCTSAHTSGASTEPGVGVDWATVWETTTYHKPAEGKLQFSVNANTVAAGLYLKEGLTTGITFSGVPRGRGKVIRSELNQLLAGAENEILAQGDLALSVDYLYGTESAPLYNPGLAHNATATADPTTGDDSLDGYGIGSTWLNTTSGRLWLCLDPTEAAAVWRLVVLALPVESYATDATLSALPGRRRIIADTSAGNVTLTLHAAAGDATTELAIIKSSAANSLTIRPAIGETINGLTGDQVVTALGSPFQLWPVTGGWLHINPLNTIN